MYRFNKMKDSDGVWRFELDGIKLLVNDFFIKDKKHWLKNPTKAIAFFSMNDNLYGISNREPITYNTVEDFYDIMRQQYLILKYGSRGGLKKSA